MTIEEQVLASPEALLDVLSARSDGWQPRPLDWVFRGQSDSRWALKPKALRAFDAFEQFGIRADPAKDDLPTREWQVLNQLLHRMLLAFEAGLNTQGAEIPAPAPDLAIHEKNKVQPAGSLFRKESFPLLALAQHHGLPTTLLDWSRRSLVAAYFAARDAALGPPSDAEHIVVWALFRGGTSDLYGASTSGLPLFYDAPASTNPNLFAQAGLFTWMEEWWVNEAIESVCERSNRPLKRLLMPRVHARRLLRMLSEEGVDGATMFPGPDGVVQAMRERAVHES